MYFDNFPSMLYPFVINGKTEYRLMKDITQNVRLRKQILANITLFDEYDIRDGETPEIIAEKIYGSPLYHWVVMLCNERYNYIEDFPLSAQELENHVTKKYGSGNEYNTHHYEDTNGYIVSSPFIEAEALQTGIKYVIRSVGTTNFKLIGADTNKVGTIFTATGAGTGTGLATQETLLSVSAISNYDYEIKLNETKRRIKLISPSLLSAILKNFGDLI